MKKRILSYDETSRLCLELSLFMHAGADIGSGISLLADETVDAYLEQKLRAMAKEIDAGQPLSAAAKQSEIFPDDVISMLKVGEHTGRTEETLTALSKYYESRHIQDHKLRNALIYPSMLLLVMLTVIVTLLTKVLPIFSEVYASHGGNLTGFAGGLLKFGSVLNSSLPFLALLMVLAVVILITFAFSERFRECVFFSSKSFKGITKALGMARFARALSMGLSSGLTSDDALEGASSLLSGIPEAKKRCNECLKSVSDGESLSNAIGKAGLMPAAECRLLSIGFAGGSSETVMEQIALRLERNAEEETERKLGFIEPAIVIVTSLLVGLILLAVMLPLTNIMSAIG